MSIKTFRGLLVDGGQDRIRLQHIDGKTGYNIKKFDIIVSEPGEQTSEHVLKIFSIEQTVINNTVDFSEQTLLGAAWLGFGASTGPTNILIDIFDNVVFNQDIFITCKDASGNSKPCNYYLELETISLDDVEATAVILKNFRNTNTVA
jgi:hypothetical protein